MKLLYSVFFFLISLASFAQDCDYSISTSTHVAVNVTTVSQVIAHSLTLTRGQNSSNGNCSNFHLYFAKGNAGSYQRHAGHGPVFPYNLYRQSNKVNILKDQGDAGPGEYIIGSAPNKNTPYTYTWYIAVPSLYDNFVSAPANVYSDTLPVRVFNVRANGNLEEQHGSHRWITMNFTVPRYVEMSLVSTNQPHDISSTVYIMNFGTMSTNQELQADLRVVGNVPFRVELASQNGGKLKRTNNLGGTEIPYTIKVGSGSYFQPTNVNSFYYLFQTNSATQLSGQRYPISVKLGNVPSKPDDGDYEEVITLKVIAH